MKNKFILVMIVLLSAFFMVSCSPSKSNYEGNWVAANGDDVEISISIDSSNKASINLLGSYGTLQGKFQDGKITFPSIAENLSITYENKELTFFGFGGYSKPLIFKKK